MSNDIYTVVAKHLRLKRLQAGLTIEDLADAAQISPSFLAYLEANKKKASLTTVVKLAKALNVSISELFNEKTVPGTPPDTQKSINKLLKLLGNQTPENTETILATLAILSKKLASKK